MVKISSILEIYSLFANDCKSGSGFKTEIQRELEKFLPECNFCSIGNIGYRVLEDRHTDIFGKLTLFF